MVKRSSKNNRSHRATKVTQKKHSKDAVWVKGCHKLGWNPKKTLKQNSAAAGLADSVNSYASILQHRGVRLSKQIPSEFLEMMDVAAPLPFPDERNPTRPEHFMKEEEVFYLQVRWRQLSAFHGPLWLLCAPLLALLCVCALGHNFFLWRWSHTVFQEHTLSPHPFHFFLICSTAPLQPLINKYKENYAAMYKDMRLNYNQHTAQHLETRCKRLHMFLAAKEEEGAMGEEGAGARASADGGGGGRGGSSSSSSMQEEGGKAKRRGSVKVIDLPNAAGDEEAWEELARKNLTVPRKPKMR